MTTKQFLGLLILALLLYSCHKEKNTTDPEFPFSAEVLGPNPDCGIYSIKITEGNENVISIIGSTSPDSVYIANNLPEEFKIRGLKIKLNFRKPENSNNELGACTAMGPGYPWIFVTTAAKK
jgi:hypothetical protein